MWFGLNSKKHAVPGSGISVDRPTGRSFALHELITPQIDQSVESRLRRDLIAQFLMVEGVGPIKDSVRSRSGFAHTNEYPISVQSGRANDTPVPGFSTKYTPCLCQRGETSSLSTAFRRRLATGIVPTSTHHTCGRIPRTHTHFRRRDRPPERGFGAARVFPVICCTPPVAQLVVRLEVWVVSVCKSRRKTQRNASVPSNARSAPAARTSRHKLRRRL